MKHKNKSKQKTGAKKQIFQSNFHLQTTMFSLALAVKKKVRDTYNRASYTDQNLVFESGQGILHKIPIFPVSK